MYSMRKVFSIVLLCTLGVGMLDAAPKKGKARNANKKVGTLKNLKKTNDTEQLFNNIFEQNLWQNSESVSGGGSTVTTTESIRKALPHLLQGYSISSLLDVPCGDFNWLHKVDLGICSYIGMDIVKKLVDRNARLYTNNLRVFKHENAITGNLPKVDLIMCRDMFVHFDFASILKTLANFKRSGSRYVLMTVHPHFEQNIDIHMGNWRPLNFQKAPFNFPDPLCLVPDRENDRDAGGTKYLGLWLLQDLPV